MRCTEPVARSPRRHDAPPRAPGKAPIHLIGHTHGRAHAPCGGADGPDPLFPHAGGGIGTWGYGILQKQLFAPERTTDMMGYCTPTWVSDYTFKALFQRVRFVSGASLVVPEEMMNRRYERVRIDSRGDARFLPAVALRKPPMAESRAVLVETSTGVESVAGQCYKYDHIAGGLMYIPQPSGSLRSVRMELDGRQISAVK